MTPTITITEEAQAFFARTLDPALRELVDSSARDYSEFMGGLPFEIDAFSDEDSTFVQVYVTVMAPAGESMMPRLVEFSKGWTPRHSREERRRVGFSVHYV